MKISFENLFSTLNCILLGSLCLVIVPVVLYYRLGIITAVLYLLIKKIIVMVGAFSFIGIVILVTLKIIFSKD